MKKGLIVLCILMVLVMLFSFATLTSCKQGEAYTIDLSSDNIKIVFFETPEFEYNGSAKRPNFQILEGNKIIEEYYLGVPNNDIIVEYENNKDVGTATVTVIPGPSGKYTGKVVGYFQIVASKQKVEAEDFQTLKDYLEGGRYEAVTVTADMTVPEGETIIIADGVTLNMGGHALINNGNIENNGDIGFDEYGEENLFSNGGAFTNNGKLLLYVTDENAKVFVNDGKFANKGELYLNGKEGNRMVAINNGSFINDGDLNLNAHTDFYNYGTFENGGNVRNSSASGFFTDSDVKGNIINNMSRRYSIEDFDISLSYDRIAYDGNEKRPSVSFYKECCDVDYDDYEITYEDNVNVGTATVNIVATEDSDALYGETALTFEIEKGSVTVADREGFYSVITNPNYREINLNTIDEFGTLFNEGFTVPEGLTLNISAASDEGLNGNVVNNGRIVVLKNNGLRVYGTLENNGEISVNQIVNRGKIENNGTINLGTGISYSGDMINAGEITLAEKGSLYAGGNDDDAKEFINDGIVTALGKVYIKHTLTNNGKFENNGELYVFSTGNVTAKRQIENSGNVYLNEESDAFGGSGCVTVKSEIMASDVHITNLPFVYDGNAKKASVKIAGGISDRYDITYVQGITEIDYPINAGNYKLTVTFREDSKLYKGNATVEFTVGRAEITVSTYDDLCAAFDNYNYERVIYDRSYITEDLEVPEGYVLVIPEGQMLANSEYRIEVNGTVENNGVYTNTTISSTLTVNDGGSFINNGTSYFNDSVPAGVSGNGTVYIRENIASATVLTLAKTQVVYCMENGYIKTETPDFTLTTVDGGEVDEGDYSSFCMNYYEISTEGDLAKLTVRASSTSTKYYGEKSAEYSVLPGETAAATFEELKTALGNIKVGTELCNFGKITLTADIDVEGNRTEQTLAIPTNVTLVLDDYRIDLSPEGTFDENVFLENNGVIEMTSYNIDCRKKTGNGKYIGYASTASVLSSLATQCDEVYLTADITEEVRLYANTSAIGECVIDARGFDIQRITVKMQGRKNYTIKSSVQGSVIGGEGYSDSGIYCEEINSKSTLTLADVKVYGIEYNLTSASEENVVIEQSCTVIG